MAALALRPQTIWTPKVRTAAPGAFSSAKPLRVQVGESLRREAPWAAIPLQAVESPDTAPGTGSSNHAPNVFIELVRGERSLSEMVTGRQAILPNDLGDEGYIIEIESSRVSVTAATPSGAFYGAMALRDLLSEQDGETPLPAGAIVDWPSLRRRGIHFLVKSRADLADLELLISSTLPRMRFNELVLEINYCFDYQSHPEVVAQDALTLDDCRRLKQLCAERAISVIPMINCLGHQSWAETTFQLLAAHPEFDETPGPQTDPGFYCRSWCPSLPEANALVFDLIDELTAAFDAASFHAGMDEVFVLGECPRCKGKAPDALFAKAVSDIYAHVVETCGLEMLIWGDRLIDAAATGYGLWEASGNATAAAIERIPKDIVICDWHYEAAYNGQTATYPSVADFQAKGFSVWPAGWNSADNARLLAGVALEQGSVGYMATTWAGVQPVARGLRGDAEACAQKNIPGIAAAIEVGSRVAWTGSAAAIDELIAV